MQTPVSELTFLFESPRSHKHGAKDTSPTPPLPLGTTLIAYMSLEGYHSLGCQKATTGPKQAYTTTTAISLAGK